MTYLLALLAGYLLGWSTCRMHASRDQYDQDLDNYEGGR